MASHWHPPSADVATILRKLKVHAQDLPARCETAAALAVVCKAEGFTTFIMGAQQSSIPMVVSRMTTAHGIFKRSRQLAGSDVEQARLTKCHLPRESSQQSNDRHAHAQLPLSHCHDTRKHTTPSASCLQHTLPLLCLRQCYHRMPNTCTQHPPFFHHHVTRKCLPALRLSPPTYTPTPPPMLPCTRTLARHCLISQAKAPNA
ncbi:hypothetical protein F5148DRAFT_1152873 [Russula earlei]|uniref:Uncharacterized protein n=1 Tax=Russula earlei TaxID=71964 RepID=A0ACC0TV76_9AGAM|nr:hypothetical protein F5148DRAFT_1152873 [Russula earlei]